MLSAARFSTAVRTVRLSVKLGLCPSLLAMCWPFSLGISNLHNHCWLLLTALSLCLSVWLESPLKKCRLPKNFPLNYFLLSSADLQQDQNHRVHKSRGFAKLTLLFHYTTAYLVNLFVLHTNCDLFLTKLIPLDWKHHLHTSLCFH